MLNKDFYCEISDLIAKEVSGIITPEEEEVIKKWRDEDSRRVELYERITKRLKEGNRKIYYEEKVILEDWRNTKRQLPIDPSKWHFFNNAMKYAAMLAFMFGIGWMVKERLRPINNDLVPVVYSAIEPGMFNAVLTLANGEQIILHAQESDSIRKEGILIKNQLGRLIYDTLQKVINKDIYNVITVPRGGEYQVVLSDGTRVWMNAETELTYPVVFLGKERKVKLSGEAYFEVSKDAEHPFIVSTDAIDIKVLGTSFNVNAYKDEKNVVTTLLEGKIQINSQEEVLKVLEPSDQGIWSRETESLQVRKVCAAAYIQWRDGDFSFRDDDLETIMRNLARWYGMEYEFKDPELKTVRFYGVVNRYHDVIELLSQFEKTGKVHFEVQGTKISVTK